MMIYFVKCFADIYCT